MAVINHKTELNFDEKYFPKRSRMAAHYRAQLTQMSTSAGGSHRDLAEKYKVVLDSILQLGEDELVDGLKSFIDAIGKAIFHSKFYY